MSFIDTVKNKYGELSRKKYFYLFASIPWVAYIIRLAVWTLKKGNICYLGNDDSVLNLIVSGNFGKKYSMNIYNNIIQGFIFKVLYSVSPSHNWYTYVQFFIIFACFLAFGVVCICKNKIIKGYLISFIVLWVSYRSLLCSMTYSQTSAFSLAVGIGLLLVGVDSLEYRDIKHRICQITGGLLMIVGGLLRIDPLYAALPFVGLIFVYLIIKYGKEVYKRLLPILIVSAVLIVSWGAHKIAYQVNPDWKYFTEYNKYRTTLIDYGIPDYEENREQYEAINFSKNDYDMLNFWSYADTEVFSIEVLKNIIQIKENSKEVLPLDERIQQIADEFLKIANGYNVIYVVLFFFFISCICSDKKYFWFQLLSMLFSIGEILGLILVGRALERAILVPVFVALVLLSYFQNEPKELGLVDYKGIICFVLIGIYAYYMNGFSMIEKDEQRVYDSTYSSAVFEYTQNHKDSLFVYNVAYEDYWLNYCYSPFDDVSNISRENMAVMGAWFVPSPVVTNIIEPYGDKYNLFECLSVNPKVYWITDGDYENSDFVEYMEYHYGVRPTFIDDILGVYKVVSFAYEN